MKIVRLQIKNFLSISDAEIKPGAVNQIVGNNNQGKTTVLKALEVALKGSTDGSLVKHGEDQAEIIVEFENAMSVRRRLKSDGKQEVLVKKGEFKADSPQSMLNGLLTAGAFNPLDLLDPKVRSEALLKAIDIRLDQKLLADLAGDSPIPLPPVEINQHGLKVLDQAHKYFYMRRSEANKDAKAKQDTYRVKQAELPEMPKVVDEKTSSDQIKEKIVENRRLIATERDKVEGFRRAKLSYDQAVTTLADYERKKVHLEQQLVEAVSAIEIQKGNVQILEKRCNEQRPLDSVIQNLTDESQSLQAELTLRAEISAVVERYKAVEELATAAKQAKDFAEKLSLVVDRLGDQAKAQLMSTAELPIAGLTYEDGEFKLDGCSIDNLSSSMALKLGVAIARKLSGSMKMICIDGAELLDEGSYEALRKEIDGDGFTYFITKVGEAFKHEGDQVLRMQEGRVAQ